MIFRIVFYKQNRYANGSTQWYSNPIQQISSSFTSNLVCKQAIGLIHQSQINGPNIFRIVVVMIKFLFIFIVDQKKKFLFFAERIRLLSLSLSISYIYIYILYKLNANILNTKLKKKRNFLLWVWSWFQNIIIETSWFKTVQWISNVGKCMGCA